MEPNRDCPRFARCSVNNCPLTAKYPDWPTHPDDPERRCTFGKTRRLRIAARYPGALRYGGLKSREYNGKLREERLTPEQRAERAERLERARQNSR